MANFNSDLKSSIKNNTRQQKVSKPSQMKNGEIKSRNNSEPNQKKLQFSQFADTNDENSQIEIDNDNEDEDETVSQKMKKQEVQSMYSLRKHSNKSNLSRRSVKSRQNKSIFKKEQLLEKLQIENQIIKQKQLEKQVHQQEELENEKQKNQLREFIQQIKMRNFFTYIADNLESRRYLTLKPKHFELLNVHQGNSYINFKQSLNLYYYIPKINPDRKCIIFLDIVSIFVIMYLIFLSNLHMCFDYEYYKEISYQYAVYPISLFLILELFIRSNVAANVQGKIIYDPVVVWKKFTKQLLVQDLLAVILLVIQTLQLNHEIPKINEIQQYYIQIFDILILLKIRSLRIHKKRLEHRIIISGLETHFLVLVNMLVQIILMSHLIACSWYALQRYEINNGESQTWLQYFEHDEKEWYSKYIMCYYWSTATIMLIGTQGNTNWETVFGNFILFFTVGIFAYILENIAQTINSITKDSMEYKANLEILNKYMKNKNLDTENQIVVRQQLEFCYRSSQEINTNKQAIQVLEQLPDNLSISIRNQINSSLIKMFIPLTKNFCDKTIELTYENPNIMSETSYVSHELIFGQNENQDIYLYLILNGEVEIFYNKEKEGNSDMQQHQVHVIKRLQAGNLLGIESFFSGQVPTYSARSTQFTNICRIKRSGFINLLKYNPMEHEKFCTIKDQFRENGITQYYNRGCILCNNHKHNEQNCNLLFYYPRRYKLFLKERWQKSFKQKRQRYYRETNDSQIKRINSWELLETNILLNNHFNYKYPDDAAINNMYYIDYIQNLIQMEYVSETDETDSEQSEKNEEIENNNKGVKPILRKNQQKKTHKLNNNNQYKNQIKQNENQHDNHAVQFELRRVSEDFQEYKGSSFNSQDSSEDQQQQNAENIQNEQSKKQLQATQFFKKQKKKSIIQANKSFNQQKSNSSNNNKDDGNKLENPEKDNDNNNKPKSENLLLQNTEFGGMMQMFQSIMIKEMEKTTECVKKQAQKQFETQSVQLFGQYGIPRKSRQSRFMSFKQNSRSSQMFGGQRGSVMSNYVNQFQFHDDQINQQGQQQQRQRSVGSKYFKDLKGLPSMISDSLIFEMDRQQEFEFYFVKYNLSNVLKSYLKKYSQLQRKLKQSLKNGIQSLKTRKGGTLKSFANQSIRDFSNNNSEQYLKSFNTIVKKKNSNTVISKDDFNSKQTNSFGNENKLSFKQVDLDFENKQQQQEQQIQEDK